MRTIVVPLDGSPLAEQALPAAQVFASLLHARIHLLQAVLESEQEPVDAEAVAARPYGAPLALDMQRDRVAAAQAHRRAEAYLDDHAQQLRGAGFPVQVALCGGEPARAIADYASANNAALIAAATHGYSGVRRWALGSVASKLAQATHVPLFLARSGGQAIRRAHALRRILVPLDGSAHARAALPLALDLARRSGAELVLFHAVARMAIDAASHYGALVERERERQEQALRALQALAAQAGSPDVAVRTLVALGFPADEIARVAVWEQADLIVMASHGYSGVQRWALGSVADKVLHASTVPLILVRPQMSPLHRKYARHHKPPRSNAPTFQRSLLQISPLQRSPIQNCPFTNRQECAIL